MLSDIGPLRPTSCVREIFFISVPGRSKIEGQLVSRSVEKWVENGFLLLELDVEECGKSEG